MAVVTEKLLETGTRTSTEAPFDTVEPVTVRHIMAQVANLAFDSDKIENSPSATYPGFTTRVYENAPPQDGKRYLGSVEMPSEGELLYIISEPVDNKVCDPFALTLDVLKADKEPRQASQIEAEELLLFLESFTPIRQQKISAELGEFARIAYEESQGRLQKIRGVSSSTLPLPDTFYDQ